MAPLSSKLVPAIMVALASGGAPIAACAQKFTPLWQFGSGGDGKRPVAALLYNGGKLYGTTLEGGTGSDGTIFVVTPKKRSEQVLHNFNITVDGNQPASALIDVGGLFYGTTSSGGPNNGYGTVFAFDPTTNALSTIHTFSNGADGGGPTAGLLYRNGVLYGTASTGGTLGKGTVFSINIATGALTTLYAFAGGADAALPKSALIWSGGLLMGTSVSGGASGDGTVYAVDPATGAESVLHSFEGADGSQPVGSLSALGNVVYSTATIGGDHNFGVLFSLDTVDLQETTLHSFAEKDGEYPNAGLLNVNNILYGTTESLGKGGGAGTVFSFNPNGNKLKLVFHFPAEGTSGGNPYSNLILYGKTIFGTTADYGKYGGGTAFEIQSP